MTPLHTIVMAATIAIKTAGTPNCVQIAPDGTAASASAPCLVIVQPVPDGTAPLPPPARPAATWWFLAGETSVRQPRVVQAIGPFPTEQMCKVAQDKMNIDNVLKDAQKNGIGMVACPCYDIIQPCTATSWSSPK